MTGFGWFGRSCTAALLTVISSAGVASELDMLFTRRMQSRQTSIRTAGALHCGQTSRSVLRRTISVAVGVCRMSVSTSRSPFRGKSPKKRSPEPAQASARQRRYEAQHCNYSRSLSAELGACTVVMRHRNRLWVLAEWQRSLQAPAHVGARRLCHRCCGRPQTWQSSRPVFGSNSCTYFAAGAR